VAGERLAEHGNAAIVVAHPDDETLWAGGTILMHPDWNWTIVTLCRGSDPDRAPRFFRALSELRASGAMADLDDGPGQEPLAPDDVKRAILSILPGTPYHLLVTHAPRGEYTRHRRHEEACRAVVSLWKARAILAEKLWMFAYDDAGGQRLPTASTSATVRARLPQEVWERKHALIERTYGFTPDSFESRVTPREEAFRDFERPADAEKWVMEWGEEA
jgi:LmbE family N-acetylglucosaminyl deacetylase